MKSVIALLALSCLLCACSREQPAAPTESPAPAPAPAPAPITELQRIDMQVAPGEGISQGQVAVVHYTGWLYEPAAPDSKGVKFDSSRDRGQPFRFEIGRGQVNHVAVGFDQNVREDRQRLSRLDDVLHHGEALEERIAVENYFHELLQCLVWVERENFVVIRGVGAVDWAEDAQVREMSVEVIRGTSGTPGGWPWENGESQPDGLDKSIDALLEFGVVGE